MYPAKDFIKLIDSGEYDSRIAALYTISKDEIINYRERLITVIKGFTDTFGDKSVRLFSSPGRAELIGNHTDHQRGQVLTAALTRDILSCAAPNGTDTIRIISKGFDEIIVNVTETDVRPDEFTKTSALVRGIVKGMKASGVEVKGFDAYMVSDIPIGTGLSSSAAFELMLAVIINAFFCDNKLDKISLAAIGMFAENKYFGKSCGMMDQTACALGGICHINFNAGADAGITFNEVKSPSYERIDLVPEIEGMAICMIDTGSEHSELKEEFDAIPGEMKAAARVLGGEVLGEIDEDYFLKNIILVRQNAGDRAVLRSMHWFDECKRVRCGAEALKKKNIERFFEMADSSGKSSFMYLQNIDSYRDTMRQPVAVVLYLVQKLLNGKGACRVHGGGFAGSVIAFVPVDMKEDFKEKVEELLGEGACRYLKVRKEGACMI